MFASKDKPLRCSALAKLAQCSARVYLMSLIESNDEGGVAAQTGSLTHEGVEAFHKELGSLADKMKAAYTAIVSARSKFPLAEPREVELFLEHYMNDPLNQRAKFLTLPDGTPAVEVKLDFTLEPHPIDETCEPIHVQGTCDQIRDMGNGMYRVFDLKTGKISGLQMIHDYAVQQAAYTYGAMVKFPKLKFDTPRIIRNYTYRQRDAVLPSPTGVFWEMPFRVSDIPTILENVRLHVALMRAGHVNVNPGPHCTYCEFGTMQHCLQQLEKITGNN